MKPLFLGGGGTWPRVGLTSHIKHDSTTEDPTNHQVGSLKLERPISTTILFRRHGIIMDPIKQIPKGFIRKSQIFNL